MITVSITKLYRKNPQVFDAFYRDAGEVVKWDALVKFIENETGGNSWGASAYVDGLYHSISDNPNTPLWQHFKSLKEQGYSL